MLMMMMQILSGSLGVNDIRAATERGCEKRTKLPEEERQCKMLGNFVTGSQGRKMVEVWEGVGSYIYNKTEGYENGKYGGVGAKFGRFNIIHCSSFNPLLSHPPCLLILLRKVSVCEYVYVSFPLYPKLYFLNKQQCLTYI